MTDKKLYVLAENVFEAFREFLTERNRIVGIESPFTYISDEDGQTIVYTRGEYATELIDGISALHGIDPLRHAAFKTAIELTTTQELLNELVKRDGVERYHVSKTSGYRITLLDGMLDPAEESGYGEATIIVVRGKP